MNPEYMPGSEDMMNGSADLMLTVYGNGTCPEVYSVMTVIVYQRWLYSRCRWG
ncbi:MAG: hypothetical protein R2764_21165 [Bacteroidales bacterium]